MEKIRKPLKIAQIAPLWISVPPKKYGGTERITSFLTEELVKRGNKVILFASGDSKTKAKLVSVLPRALIEETLYNKPIPWSNTIFSLLHLANAFKMAENFDIIHIHENNSGLSNFFIPFIKTPTVITLHDPFPGFKDRDKCAAFLKYKNHRYISVSLSQQKLWKNLKLNFVGNVYNGINTSLFRLNERKENYLSWLGRFTPKKGAKEAILAAKATNKKLILAGRIDKNSLSGVEYFEKEIKPHLGKDIRYIGEINDKQKQNVIGKAEALLCPIQWEEPCPLAFMESMACGTPVIAFDRGSARELINDGKTGFVVKPFDKKGKPNLNGFIEAIKKIDQIDRQECRRWVEEKFTIEKMVNNYEKLFYKILKKHGNV